MKLWIASDNTRGAMYDVAPFRTMDGKGPVAGPIDIAYKYGRAEAGEIIHIWLDDNVEREPDHKVYWNDYKRVYRTY